LVEPDLEKGEHGARELAQSVIVSSVDQSEGGATGQPLGVLPGLQFGSALDASVN
jgi:hypothetical protein